ncbi:MAG: hypothetical protein DSY43_05215 [Gammaproteobacteria bacterium]|nr:MAG: hypothetical protein DSY43_05215 [Gammaproteobacteria bacterium]
MKFLILLMLSTSVLALKPHTAIYTLAVSDFEIADVHIVLNKENNIYTYTLDARTEGLVALIKDYQIHSKSTFSINQFGIQSQRYQNFERDGDTTKKDIDIQLEKNQVDPLNQTLAISNALEKNPHKKDFYFLLNNGKRISKKHYSRKHNSEDTIKIISENGETEVYFSRKQHYIPTLIRNKKVTYRLKTLRLSPPL